MIFYMRLQEVFFRVRNNLGTYEGVSCPLAGFFSSFKNGSKSIRRIFEKDRSKKIKVSASTSTTTFCRLIGIPSIDESILKMMLSVWGLSFLSNKHREFSFKFYNNTLGLNTRLSHFVENNTRSCTVHSVLLTTQLILRKKHFYIYFLNASIRIKSYVISAKFSYPRLP